MLAHEIGDWDDAYANGAHIVGGADYPPRWAAAAQKFRTEMTAAGRAQLDIGYGSGPRNRFDLFLPEAPPKGLTVFVHGGYWMRFAKSDWSHLAAGPLAHGFAVAMPSYALCPEVRISGITREIGAAVSAAAARIDGPLLLSGHSAGGHLVTRMICRDSPLPDEVRGRIRHVLSISGVHDLRPLMRTAMNETLKLDAREAGAESPALLDPVEGIRLTCWVGGAERSEFLRQNALLANVWTGLGARTACVEEPDRHHFNIVEGLAEPCSPITAWLCAEA